MHFLVLLTASKNQCTFSSCLLLSQSINFLGLLTAKAINVLSCTSSCQTNQYLFLSCLLPGQSMYFLVLLTAIKNQCTFLSCLLLSQSMYFIFLLTAELINVLSCPIYSQTSQYLFLSCLPPGKSMHFLTSLTAKLRYSLYKFSISPVKDGERNQAVFIKKIRIAELF